MTAIRKRNLTLLCLPLAGLLAAIAAAGDYLVRQYPVEQRLDIAVLAAIGAVVLGVLATGWWTQLVMPEAAPMRLELLSDAQQVMHDFAWLPIAFALFLSTALFVIAVAALTGSWYMFDRRVRIERDRVDNPPPGLVA